MRFKSYLNENMEDPNISEFLKKVGISTFTTNADGRIDVRKQPTGNVTIDIFPHDIIGGEMPFKLNICEVSINTHDLIMNSWDWLPREMPGNSAALRLHGSNIDSFEHLPKIISGNLVVADTKIESWAGIEKITFGNDSVVYFNPDITFKNALRILLIESPPAGISTRKGTSIAWDSEYYEAFEIIRKYLRTGSESIFDCQEELIKAGFEELAQL